jgi:hypothetical protein
MTKKLISLIIIIKLSVQLYGQFNISAPYEDGQVQITINIDYPKNITSADSVRLEVSYDTEPKPEMEFMHAITVKDLPSSIKPGFDFDHTDGIQSYRCLLYQKDKEPLISNVATIDYYPYKYSKSELPKVSNVQHTFIEKDGEQYVRISWDAIPEALGYMVAKKTGGLYYGFQLYYDGPYSKTSNTYLDIPAEGSGEVQYGVCGIQNPNDFQPAEDILTIITVNFP